MKQKMQNKKHIRLKRRSKSLSDKLIPIENDLEK